MTSYQKKQQTVVTKHTHCHIVPFKEAVSLEGNNKYVINKYELVQSHAFTEYCTLIILDKITEIMFN